MKKEQVLHCQFSAWYPLFRSLTIKSVILPLPQNVKEYLLDDGTLVVSGREEPPARSQPDSDDETEEIQWSDDDNTATLTAPEFPEFTTKVQEAINSLGVAYFLNLTGVPQGVPISSLVISLNQIEKFQKGEGKDEEKYIDVVINKNMKLGQKVLIPVKQFPKFNFVGKLLGPRGNSLKRLQEETLTKMSILGKGSMRDKAKEEELRKSGEAKYFHLNDDLHVLIEVFAPPAEAYARMGHALEEIKKFLIPDYNDEIRQAQLQELTYLNGGSENADVPVVRGKPPLRTRGVPTTAVTRGRGGATARPVGVGVPRGTAAPRGVLPTRGPASRGRGLLPPRARGVPSAGCRPPPPPPTRETYGEYDYDDGYGTAYDDQSYDSYDASYSTPAQSGTDYYDYGHGLSEETYDSYGQEDWTNSRHKAPSARATKGVYRDQPYGRY